MSQIALLFVYHIIDLILIFCFCFCLLLKIPEIMAQITSEKWAKNIGQQGKKGWKWRIGNCVSTLWSTIVVWSRKVFAAGGRDKGTAEPYPKGHSHAYAVYCCQNTASLRRRIFVTLCKDCFIANISLQGEKTINYKIISGRLRFFRNTSLLVFFFFSWDLNFIFFYFVFVAVVFNTKWSGCGVGNVNITQ